MTVPGTTSLVRRQLGRRLKQLREAAGIMPRDVEAAHLASQTKISRMERGLVPTTLGTVRNLAEFYGVDDQTRTQLESLALGTNGRGWWQDYEDVLPEWFRLYVDLESHATTIHSWDEVVVPGVFQTADYAAAIFSASVQTEATVPLERRIAVRLARQERLLDRSPAPRITALVGEGALARHVGGRDVMVGQLARLRELAERQDIEIRVLPFATGAHPAMTGAFRILDFADDEDPDVVYLEAMVGGRYLELPEELARYRAAWEKIAQQSIPIGDYQ